MQTPVDVLDHVRTFMTSRVILSAAELDLFTRLDERPRAAVELAASLDLDLRALTRLLDCLVGLDLVRKRAGMYTTTTIGECLSARHPSSVLPMVRHLNTIWDNWSRLTASVRSGGNPDRRPVVHGASEEDTSAFIGAMHVVARQTASDIAASCDAGRFARLLDVGGGSGAYTIAFLLRNPRLRAVLFDLPEVIRIASENVEQAGLSDRVTFAAGDFYRDELPGGCDGALLSAIIHQNSPQENLELYGKIHRALEPGGVLLIRDHIMDDCRTSPPEGALFALNMLVNTPAGDTYTLAEVEETLKRAGFVKVKMLCSGRRMDCVVEAMKV